MKLSYIYSLIMLLTCLPIFTSCSDSPSFSLTDVKEKVTQNTVNNQQTSKVDILWVIDNSNSMRKIQQDLTDNFSSFIQKFATQEFDFQIGVAATDSYRVDEAITTNYNPTAARLRDGDRSEVGSGVFILRNNTPNLISTFVKNATLGVKGDGDERAFSSLEYFFNESFNNDFLRPDSHLAIIIVSDEDDLSYQGKGSHDLLRGQKPELFPISRFVNLLDDKTNSSSDDKRYSVSSIHIKTGDTACLNSYRTQTQKYGTRYEELVTATGGTEKNIISLCSQFADSLEGLSQTIIEQALNPTFKIKREPIPSTIVVNVNGKRVARSVNGSSGWSYESPEAGVYLIIFSKDTIPPSGATVEVNFTPAKFED